MEFDKDLTARQEARELARRAETAQRKLAELSQSQLDAIVEAVAKAFAAQASALAEMAVQETGFGNAEDKTTKNLFASQRVAEAVRGMKTVGILREVPEKKLWEIGVPVGVIAAIIPSTNPTSTVCYKAMIALKSGNAIVFSPHPKAIACTRKAAQIVSEAAQAAWARETALPISTAARMSPMLWPVSQGQSPLTMAPSALPSRASLWRRAWKAPCVRRGSGRAFTSWIPPRRALWRSCFSAPTGR